jgi:CheY-like chemotaxis protein
MSEEQFAEQVRDALVHFHDRARLQTHPLTRALLSGPFDGREGGRLQRRLLEAIEELTPSTAHPDVPEWRRARHLFLRYVERLSHEQVVAALGISHRQGHRDHHEGVAALASLLWAQRSGAAEPELTADQLVEAQAQRLASGTTRGPSDVVAALRHALATTAELVAGRGVRVVVEATPGLPAATVDASILRQGVLAALSLSVERCAGGELRVRVTSDEAALRLTLEPVGELSTEDVSRLSVIRRLLAVQDGAVELRGSAVEMTLPVARSGCVLVIDDDPDFRRLLARYLSGYPYRVVAAADADEGLRLASEVQPELVILDVLMPSQDGWDLLRELRALPETRSVPILVCSVLGDRELARSLGATDVMAKPVTQQALLAAIEAHRGGSGVGSSR